MKKEIVVIKKNLAKINQACKRYNESKDMAKVYSDEKTSMGDILKDAGGHVAGTYRTDMYEFTLKEPSVTVKIDINILKEKCPKIWESIEKRCPEAIKVTKGEDVSMGTVKELKKVVLVNHQRL